MDHGKRDLEYAPRELGASGDWVGWGSGWMLFWIESIASSEMIPPSCLFSGQLLTVAAKAMHRRTIFAPGISPDMTKQMPLPGCCRLEYRFAS